MSVHLFHQREEFSKWSMQKKQLKHQGKQIFFVFVTFKTWLTNIFSTIMGVRCKDGIIIGTEKIVVNKMMLSGTDKRIYSVTPSIGAVDISCFILLGLQWSYS